MLSIPATGLLNVSPVVKTQQSQHKYDSMPALKRVNKDTTTFTSWQKELSREKQLLLNSGDGDRTVNFVMSIKGVDKPGKVKILEDFFELVKDVPSRSDCAFKIKRSINRLRG